MPARPGATRVRDSRKTPGKPYAGARAAGRAYTHAIGKPLDRCGKAVAKALRKLTTRRLQNVTKCANEVFKCEQTKANDPACIAKASGKCTKAFAQIAKAEGKLTATVNKGCGDAGVFATLQSMNGGNIDGVVDDCAAVAIAPVDTLADYTECLTRSITCGADELARFAVPRLSALLAVVGRDDDGDAAFCAAP